MADTSRPVLEAHQLTFRWPGSHDLCVNIPELVLKPGERVLLLGPSGCGKSTLLGLLGGVLTPTGGTVNLMGHSLTGTSARRRDQLRADHVGFIFQQLNLVPYLSLEDNVLLPCRFSAQRRKRAGQPRKAARALMHALELPESLWKRPVTHLSVGQQQRAAAARALIGSPALLIADEPTSALDPENRDRLMSLLISQLDRHGSALLIVSHDEALHAHVERTLPMRSLNQAVSSMLADGAGQQTTGTGVA